MPAENLKEPDKDEPAPPPPYEEVCSMPGHHSVPVHPPQPYDLSSFASPSDMMVTPHCYPPPSSLMHGAYDSPQPFMYGYQSQHQGPQRQVFTPHDLQVLARMRDRPVTLMARVPMDSQRRKIYIKVFTLVGIVIAVVCIICAFQWYR
ncbi:uncharacterized protein LOC128184374 [Crassostrea angulata]|uniref:uncharacterized protein LOC128184374 n=1 Tax=Magallana angulata TaxID=2784310 RepID=UPI0022B10238|nr:uncharacterized protein LOC128184374 [Crassostrea angulata]